MRSICCHVGRGLTIITAACCAYIVLLYQLAADILAATLLRDPGARSAFLRGGHFGSILKLLCTEDPRIQLSAVAVLAKMADTCTPSAHQSASKITMASQDPQLLLQVHSKIQDLLLQVVQQSVTSTSSTDAVIHRKADIPACPKAQQGLALQQSDFGGTAGTCMMFEYGSLAWWAASVASAQYLQPAEVYEQLAIAGQLSSMFIQLPQPSSVVICCCAGVLNTLAAKCSVAEAAALAAADCTFDEPKMAQQLQPTMAALKGLLLHGSEADLEVKVCCCNCCTHISYCCPSSLLDEKCACYAVLLMSL